MLPWECEECKHTEVASSFITFIECPNCGSEGFYHGDLIDEDED